MHCQCNKHLAESLTNLAALSEAAGKSVNAKTLTAASKRLELLDKARPTALNDPAVALIRHSLDEFIKNGGVIPESCTHFPEGMFRPTAEDATLLYNILGDSEIELATLGDIEGAYARAVATDSADSSAVGEKAQDTDEAEQGITETEKREKLKAAMQDFADKLSDTILLKSLNGRTLTPEVIKEKTADYRKFLVTMATTKPNPDGNKEERFSHLMNSLAPIKSEEIDAEVVNLEERFNRLLAKQSADNQSAGNQQAA